MEVIGIVKVDFPDKNDANKRVQGVSVHYKRPITFADGKGYMGEKVFLSDWFIQNRLNGQIPDEGDEIEFTYNRKGKIDEFRILSSSQ